MLPLLRDAFFESMAVTIMFGLGFATRLILLVVPVLYTLFYGIAYRPPPVHATGHDLAGSGRCETRSSYMAPRSSICPTSVGTWWG